MSQFFTALIVAILVQVKGDHPVSLERELDQLAPTADLVRNDEQVYRLPETVVPLEYDIYIDLYFAERTERPFSYDGRETIVIQAVEDNVAEIILHANVDQIKAVSVLTENGSPVAVNVFRPFHTVPQYHFLVINLAETLRNGEKYILVLEYANTMNVGPMKRGIWRGSYVDDNNVERTYAATHFQPYNARQAFPCWDEPLFKATFKIHLSRPASYSGVYSNTRIGSTEILPDGRVRDSFLVTPKMSSYLVTFLVSESFTVIAQDDSFTPPIRIIGRSNTVGLGDHALDLAVKMTRFFDDFFEIPYETLHPNLLNDHISSPDWASAGTENWGMVSYRELYLTLDSRESIMSNEHYAATLVSHELAHKWFGNYITCYWWSNTWINEGFASYFGYIATNAMFPQYEFEDHFNSRYLQNSLAFDSGVGTVPLNHDVNTPAQVTGHFGTISYSKGAAFLRMLRDMITPEVFKKACQYFLRDNAFEATNQNDLFQAFDRALAENSTLGEYQGFAWTEYYHIWVNEPGYPILNVDVDHSTGVIVLKQERFFLSASASPTGQIYPIPITYSYKSSPAFTNLKPIYMMHLETMNVGKPVGEEWVIFNNLQHGLYRVNYDDKTWGLISDALRTERDTIHYLNRAQIVDDIFALMRSERMTYGFGLNILRFLRDEDNMHVWDAAITGFTWLRNRLRHLPAIQAEFDEFILSNMAHLIDTVGFNVLSTETPTETMNRQAALHFACLLGHEECVAESRQRFVALRDSNAWVDGGIRRNVYVVGVREGGEQDFNFILSRFRASNLAHDQLEMLRAMAATKDPVLLTRYLELTLTNEVRSHDKVNSFNYALLGNKGNTYTVLQFVKNYIGEMRVAAFEATNQNDLFQAFDRALAGNSTLGEYQGFAWTEYYHIWVNEPGYPILNVDVDHSTGVIALKQERFFLSASASPTGQIYPIPITYSYKSSPAFTNLKPIYMMHLETMNVGKPVGEGWVIFNNLQHGLYRVNYDDKTWGLISDALRTERDTIHYLNRAQIVDDIFALMRSERMTYGFGLNILRFLRDEDNMHVWDAAITGFTWLRNRLRHLPAIQAEFDEFILSNMAHLIDTVGFNVLSTETPTETMNRQAALHFACLLGHEECVAESRQRFVALRDSNAWVDGGIRRNVYVVGVREGGEQDFNFILSRFRASNLAHDQLEMLRAMAATKDPVLLTRYLELTLTNEVRSHDKVNSFNYALLGNKGNAYTVLQFVKDNIGEMRVAYVEDSPPTPVHTCLSNLAAYLDEPELVEYEEWLRSTQIGTPQFNSAISAITSARNNMAWGTANADIILGATRDDATKIITSTTMLLTMALIAIIA